MAALVQLDGNEGLYGKASGPAGFFLRMPQWIDQVSLVASTNSAYTPPAGTKFIVISAPANDYWVRMNSAAVVPVAGITDGSGSFLNPTQLEVIGVTTVNIISEVAMYVTIAAYK